MGWRGEREEARVAGRREEEGRRGRGEMWERWERRREVGLHHVKPGDEQ